MADPEKKEEWKGLMKTAATTDFSWERSAEEYKTLFNNTIR